MNYEKRGRAAADEKRVPVEHAGTRTYGEISPERREEIAVPAQRHAPEHVAQRNTVEESQQALAPKNTRSQNPRAIGCGTCSRISIANPRGISSQSRAKKAR